MNQETLCIATFAEAVRLNFKKKSVIKNYDGEKKEFMREHSTEKDCSGVFHCYYTLLESLSYNPEFSVEGDMDIAAPKTTQLKNRKAPAPDAFVALAQLSDIANSVSFYFAANVIPNFIDKTHENIAIDAVDTLIQGDSSLGKQTQKRFKDNKQKKTSADYLAEVWVLAVTRENVAAKGKSSAKQAETDDGVYEQLPVVVTPPTEIEDSEVPYVTKLLNAYGSAENIESFLRTNPAFSKHQNHFGRQREDFYAAESVRLSTRDLFGDADPDRFEELMNELHTAIIDVYEADYDNGLLRLRAVLIKASDNDVSVCWLKRKTTWIGASQKKGVCHMLANVDTIKSWVLVDG